MQSETNETVEMYGNNRYLNPTNDIGFKKLFGTENHKNLLISFLNSILGLENNKRIQQVQLIPQEMSPLFGEGKRSILDVQCTDASGTRYIVEMQNYYAPEFIKRTQMYTSHAYVAQLEKGTQQFELSPVVLLAITNHTVFPEKQHAISYHKMLDEETLEHDLKDISYVFIELTKFHKENPDELETLLDKWMYFFKYWEKSKSPPAAITEPEILQAYDTMEKFNWNAAELDYYLKADIALAEQQSAEKKKHQDGLEKGLKKGRKQGRKQGRKEGLEEGIEKGRNEERAKAVQEKINIVHELLLQDLGLENIAKATGIDILEIEKIATELKRQRLSA